MRQKKYFKLLKKSNEDNEQLVLNNIQNNQIIEYKRDKEEELWM